jgi:hypothetical protein
MLVPDLVDRAAREWPGTEALVWPDERLTFAEFAARSRACVRARGQTACSPEIASAY